MSNTVRLSRPGSLSPHFTSSSIVLDESDRAILRALETDGRRSFRELAKVAQLSPNATAERVHRLETHGVLLGYSAIISPESLGLHLHAFVDVKLQKGVSMESFEKALRGVPGVREATSITGAFDARLRVVCQNPTELGTLIERIRVQTGAQETSSTVICRELQLHPEPLIAQQEVRGASRNK